MNEKTNQGRNNPGNKGNQGNQQGNQGRDNQGNQGNQGHNNRQGMLGNGTDWNTYRNEVRAHWDRFSDDDLNIIDGREDGLISQLEKVYGYTREQAQNEVDLFLERA